MIVKFEDLLHEKGSYGGHVEKREKQGTWKTCLKPLFCMASHNCKLKITEEKEGDRDPRHQKTLLSSLYSAWPITGKFVTCCYDCTDWNAETFKQIFAGS